MGHAISHAYNKMFGKNPLRFVMVGLDNAGKTSILYQLKLKEMGDLIPVVGFAVETIQYKNFVLTVCSLGGEKIKPLWRHYYENSEGVIFVIDAQDRETIGVAAQQLHEFSSGVAEYNFPLLIFANKQDCEGAMSLEEIQKALHPEDLKVKHRHIQPCSAKTGEGLDEGLEWLNSILCLKTKED